MNARNRRLQSGFTLIEVMVVVAILGILATIVMTNVIGKDDQARVTTTMASLSSVAKSLDLFKLDNHKYPTTDEGLNALVEKPASAKTYPDGGYLSRLPEDPWGNVFQYVYPGSNGRKYDLYSLGADGVEGGEGFDADIYYE
ncbi:MAG: type secretion system protein GspG [Moraxellaceae bacterium]|jgi:general secretion pathway protein G|nr:type secretion system protein GspG [Moraxellaceae bacterium]